MKLLIDGQTLSTPERDRGIGLAFRRTCEHLLVSDLSTEWFIAVRSATDLASFGSQVPMGRPGQPNEVAPSFLFLACSDSSYITGSFLHPNGGEATET